MVILICARRKFGQGKSCLLIIVMSSFAKSGVLKMSPSTRKRKAVFFKFLQFDEHICKAPSLRWSSVDITVEIKLYQTVLLAQMKQLLVSLKSLQLTNIWIYCIWLVTYTDYFVNLYCIFIMADDDVWNIETFSENWKALLCF